MPSFETLHRVRTAASLVQPRHLALRAFRCPMCGPSVLLRLSRETIGVRCLRCGASAATLSLACVLEDARPGFRNEAVYEMPSRAQATVERAALRDGKLEHLLPPAYHGDRIRGRGKVLVYRDYGMDIVERLRREGFAEAWVDGRFSAAFLGHGSAVVAALA